MDLRYATSELERQCTDARYMRRMFGAQVAKALRLRIDDLRAAEKMSDLLQMTGRWEELKADRAGQWSARLTANWRLIVEPGDHESLVGSGDRTSITSEQAASVFLLEDEKPSALEGGVIATVVIIEIVDYHR